MVYAMEPWTPSSGRRQHDESEFNLREWALKARNISRENTSSRRFSAPNIRSFRELETKSFRSNTTISSTASSPGYTLTDEIDPSTYSFTTALRALQARSGYGWEWLSPDGFVLNSKWNEAEKYICNPLSGEVPMECLSSKTLSRRSLSTSTSKITISAPLIYSSHARLVRSKSTATQDNEIGSHPPIQDEKAEKLNRDMNIKSTTPTDHSSSNSGPSSTTPPIEERLMKQYEVEGGEAPSNSGIKSKSDEEIEGNERRTEKDQEKRKDKVMYKCCSWQGGCLPWRRWLWMKSSSEENTKTRYRD
ncbi:hypothetical protein BVC80_1211g102 [Macleaya cordata]|uniref:Uncharacterized protein n=1 Tax=Macleaya cordata TaxID=56857 RepID=A0A200Q3J1_MACCD|nr:hypothetical protein BVC80_1211g102 [Macleaya cordata]